MTISVGGSAYDCHGGAANPKLIPLINFYRNMSAIFATAAVNFHLFHIKIICPRFTQSSVAASMIMMLMSC